MTQPITDARSWTAATIDAPAHWYYPLPDACRAVWERLRGQNRPLTEIKLSPADQGACSAALAPMRDALESGRGFAIIASPALPPTELSLLYWLVGQGLGWPFAQNVQGTMLYDVRDTGQDLSKGARFSVTSYESSFHTDNSFGSEVLDYVGLLCVNVAKSGGRSQIVSGLSVYNELQKEPEVLRTLSQPFHVDRRGGVHEGESPTIEVPVFEWLPSPLRGRGVGGEGAEPRIRYLRYWIEAGHEKVGMPLTAAQKTALDRLDACLNRRELRVEFDLRPGDMYFINNRWTLHNRTAFEDHPEPERRRHLVRLWLQKLQ